MPTAHDLLDEHLQAFNCVGPLFPCKVWGTEIYFRHQFLAHHASCEHRDLYKNPLNPILPLPALFAVCKVTPSVGAADTERDEHQNRQHHQDSTNYPTDIEVIWRREKPYFFKVLPIF